MIWPGQKRSRKNRYKKRPRSGGPGSGARRLLLVVGLGLGLAAFSYVLVLAHALLTQSPYYRAQRLAVGGNRRLSEAAVLAQAGLAPGVQILALNLGQVGREIPDTLRVTVREHQPLAVVDTGMGRRYLLDDEGDLFKSWDASDPQDLPVVTGLAYRDLPIRGRSGSDAFKAVMALLTGTGAWETLSLARVEADPEIGLTLLVAGSRQRIRMGYGQYPDKLRRLADLKARLAAGNFMHDFASIDVSDPGRIVVAPVQTPPGESTDTERS
jgi:cell division protein FtsQ